jgi:hypothetical protein
MAFKDFFLKFIKSSAPSHAPEKDPAKEEPGLDPALTLDQLNFPKDGIRWYEWNDATEKLIAEKNRPVLLFVGNPDPMVWPFLKAVFQAMPLNAELRELLHGYYPALFMKIGSVPEYFSDLGAGKNYHIAILSPAGFTPLATIDPMGGKPVEIVETIAKVLKKLREAY